MGMKYRLFASAAFPLLSLSLMVPPAHAEVHVRSILSSERPIAAKAANGSYEIAQDAPQSEEELPKKRKKQQEEQAPAAQSQQQEESAPKPKKERQSEQQPESAQEQRAPEAAPEQPAQQQERPRRDKQQRQKEATQEQQAPGAEPEQPTQERPRRDKQQSQGAAPAQQAPEAGAVEPAQQEEQPPRKRKAPTQEEAAPAPKQQEPQKQPEPTAEQPATTAEQPAQPKPRENQKDRANAESEGQRPEKGLKKPPIETKPKSQPSEQQPPVEQAVPTPEPSPAPEKAPVPQQKEQAQPQIQPDTGKAPAQQEQAAPEKQPLDQTGQTEQPIPQPEKVSPQELERRKQIAEDPTKTDQPVILPVENGAAVLDSDKDAVRGGQERRQLRAEEAPVKAPTSDADAQAAGEGSRREPIKIEAVTREEGRRLRDRPDFLQPEGARFGERQDDRVIMQINNNVIVRSDDDRRFLRNGERPLYEELSRDRYRETIERPEGYRIVTIRNRYGDIIQRSRIDEAGRESVLYYSPELYEDPDRGYFEDPGADLPPMRLGIPVRDYIIDTSTDPDRDYYEFLSEPPVEPVERVYSLNEVKYSARIRDKVRRIDLDTITFATGSAEIPMSQARTLRKVADAINEVLEKNHSETFLIEGHTDAVGSDQSNLILSDQRAESVANVLTDVYGVPPENLATQGYGERYLKVNTPGPEQENRRVTIRRVTPLVRPVASN
ncbi:MULTISPECIES: OmpA family protein [unclassified Sinorhizobium]|uniref:OmpA family protein n=1 Tax=unclassified Sinorhizobium TaxID=2613772 RepID=UPI003525D0A5